MSALRDKADIRSLPASHVAPPPVRTEITAMTNGTGECDVDEKRFWGPQAEPCKLRKLAGP